MRFSRYLAVISLVLAAGTLTALKLSNSALPTNSNEKSVNLFTGLPGMNGEILAVKVDDTKYSHPQQGIEDADIVFVTEVEAGLTRLLAIYSSTYPDLIGPIRSARISDIDILSQFGRVGFAYSGAQSKMRPILSSANLLNWSAERNSSKVFPEDPHRSRPYAMMLDPSLLLARSENAVTPRDIGISHGRIDNSSKKIVSATIHWPNAKYQAVWNQKTKRFDLLYDDSPDLNSKGELLGSPMMVIQQVEIHPSEFGDKFGGITPKTNVVGAGKGFFLREGAVTEVRWKRDSVESPTVWTLPNGEVARFAQGQVWFFLTDKKPEFEIPADK